MWKALPVLLVIGLCQAQTGRTLDTNVTSSASRDEYAYISLDAERSIALYRIDSVRGNLNFLKKIVVSGEPGALAVDPTHSFLYAAIRTTNSISSFAIDRRTGGLAFINTIRAVGNPVFVGMDKTGKFLLTAYFADSKAAVYAIRNDGSIEDSAVQVLATEKNAHAIQTDPSNRFLFIPCRTGETIHQFRFSPGNGLLTPNVPDRLITPPNTGPRHFTYHPKLPVAYFANEFGSSVTVYRLHAADGTLSAMQTLSTLPGGYAGANAAADVHGTPDGRFLYASNRGHESIAAFSIDTASGALSSIGRFVTEKTPRAFAIDPDGKFLYAGGQGSGRIAAYTINRQNGHLALFAVYDAGKNPVWILLMRARLGN